MNYNENSAIGVFDSGIGGLTAVKELIKLLPNENIIYLGDTARVPYGTRSPQTIQKYAAQNFRFLKSFNIKMIIAACGTVSSVLSTMPSYSDGDCLNGFFYTGVIRPAAQAAVSATKNKKIGVIGTDATVRSQSYKSLIQSIIPGAEVYQKACPMFVPLVENGYTQRDCIPCVEIAKEYLTPLKEAGIDTLILGCTHYPIISDVIADIMGSGVKLISSGGEAGRYAKAVLAENELLSRRQEKGSITLYCTDSAELFCKNAEHFLDGITPMEIKTCTLDSE